MQHLGNYDLDQADLLRHAVATWQRPDDFVVLDLDHQGQPGKVSLYHRGTQANLSAFWRHVERVRSTDRLANAFSAHVRSVLADDLPEILKRNATYPAGTCATHDFCDANEIMAAAWKEVMGTEVDVGDDEQSAVWSAAWNLAVERAFGARAQGDVQRQGEAS